MEDDDRPLRKDDFAGRLARESLDPYSRDELDARIALLEAEIARVKAHKARASAHRAAAEALFRSASSSSGASSADGPPAGGSPR